MCLGWFLLLFVGCVCGLALGFFRRRCLMFMLCWLGFFVAFCFFVFLLCGGGFFFCGGGGWRGTFCYGF